MTRLKQYNTILNNEIPLDRHLNYKHLAYGRLHNFAPNQCGYYLHTYYSNYSNRHFSIFGPSPAEGRFDVGYEIHLGRINNDRHSSFYNTYYCLQARGGARTNIYLGYLNYYYNLHNCLRTK